MLHLLWRGKSIETITYLQTLNTKNENAKDMLIAYLTKNGSVKLLGLAINNMLKR